MGARNSYQENLLRPESLRLSKSARGEVIVSVDGEEHSFVEIRLAFPLELSSRFVGFFSRDGEELGLLEEVDALEPASRELLLEELEKVYFRPVIMSIDHIGEEFGVVQMEAQTTSGPCHIEIRNLRKNVRTLSRDRLLIEDTDGNRYEINSWQRLPGRARSVLGL